MAVTNTAITDWKNDYTGADTNSPADSDLISTNLGAYFRNAESVCRAESINKSWERWKGLYGTLTYVSATSFTLSGDQRTSNSGPVAVGRRIKASVTAGTVYGTIATVAYTSLTTVTVSMDSGSLDSGLSEVQFGLFVPNTPFPRVGCYVTNSVAQAVPTGTSPTLLTFDTETFDMGAMHSTSANTSRITFPFTGIYSVSGCAGIDYNVTGDRNLIILLNGTTRLTRHTSPANVTASNRTILTATVQYLFSAGDYVELGVSQSSGSSLNVTPDGSFTNNPSFAAAFCC